MSTLDRAPITFNAPYEGLFEIHADQLTAHLDLQVAPGPVTVTATGPDADTIHAERDGTTIRITGGPEQTSRAIHVTSASGATMFVGGMVGDVYVNGKRINTSQPELPHVQVTVPLGTAVTVEDVYGTTKIGSTRGNLAVILSQAGTVTAGAVAGLGVEVSGAGKVRVDSVEQQLTAEISGAGRVDIARGMVDDANLKVSGAGNITFMGSATNARLRCSGAGHVYLAHALNPPTRRQSGVGSIRVGQVG